MRYYVALVYGCKIPASLLDEKGYLHHCPARPVACYGDCVGILIASSAGGLRITELNPDTIPLEDFADWAKSQYLTEIKAARKEWDKARVEEPSLTEGTLFMVQEFD